MTLQAGCAAHAFSGAADARHGFFAGASGIIDVQAGAPDFITVGRANPRKAGS